MNIKICGSCGKINITEEGKFCSEECLVEFCDKDDLHITNKRAVKNGKVKREKRRAAKAERKAARQAEREEREERKAERKAKKGK